MNRFYRVMLWKKRLYITQERKATDNILEQAHLAVLTNDGTVHHFAFHYPDFAPFGWQETAVRWLTDSRHLEIAELELRGNWILLLSERHYLEHIRQRR